MRTGRTASSLARRAASTASLLVLFSAAAGAQSRGPARLQPVSPTGQEVVLGDGATLAVRVVDAQGAPVPGVALSWEVTSAPGTPRSKDLRPPATDCAGISRVDVGFAVAGNVSLRASYPGLAPVVFAVRVGSLGGLTPDRNTYRSAGEAFDRICFNVFNADDGTPKPSPQATPLCVFMTGVLTTRAERGDALVRLSPSGLGSETKTAVAGIAEQQTIVASRLAALRGGALAAGAAQIAWSAGGKTLDGTTVAAAADDARRRERLAERVDAALAGRKGRGRSSSSTSPAPESARRWGLFLTGRLQHGEQSGDAGDETAFDFDTTSGMLGIDYSAGTNLFLGLAGGYAQNQTDLAGGGGRLEFDAKSLTLYGAWQGSRRVYFQGSFSLGNSDYDQRRRIALPVVGTLDARAEFGGDQLAGTLESGWTWGGTRVVASSFVRGSWARSKVDAFAERGAVATVVVAGLPIATDFGVALGAQDLTSILGEAGFDLAGNVSFAAGVLVPQLTLAYRHEFDDDARRVRARFLGDLAAGSSFFVFTDAPDRDWLDAGASLAAQFLWGSVFAAYDRELGRSDLELATWQAGLRFEF